MHPELGDDETKFRTEDYNGQRVLAHKDNGDCVYLDRETGCTIHDDAPAICREFDCRTLLRAVRHYPHLRINGMIPDRLLQAAKRRNKRV